LRFWSILSMELLGAARNVAQERHLAVRTLVQDVNALELEPGSYDFVICRSSLHHFVELEHVMAEVKRALALLESSGRRRVRRPKRAATIPANRAGRRCDI